MANDLSLTVVGNLTADPDLRFTAKGDAWVRFTVAHTPRRYNSSLGMWEDSDTTFLDCTAWRHIAEHTAESLLKGDRVIVTGKLRQHSWETPEGEKRSKLALDAEEIAASLRFAEVEVKRRKNTAPTQRSTASGLPVPTTTEKPPF